MFCVINKTKLARMNQFFWKSANNMKPEYLNNSNKANLIGKYYPKYWTD